MFFELFVRLSTYWHWIVPDLNGPDHGVEPFPNIRDGIFVERLVKTMRYVADMRCCQYVVQRAEGVRRRQRLNVEYVDRSASDLLVLQDADQSLLIDDRPT